MLSQKKILFITHYSILYGANKSLLGMLEAMRKYDLEVLVIIPENGPLEINLEYLKIPYIIHNFSRWVEPGKGEGENNNWKSIPSFLIKKVRNKKKHFYNLFQVINLKRKMGDFSPDYVYSNSSVINFGFLFSKYYRIPHIWHLREAQEFYNFKWCRPLYEVEKSFKNSHYVLAISEYIKNLYVEKFDLGKIKVIHDGIISKEELSHIDERIAEKEICSKIVFGIIGVIQINKGHAEAIKAFSIVNRKFKNLKLIIVGTGNQSQLVKLIQELGINSDVEFWGYVEDPFSAFIEFDIVLMCSRMEGLGRVTLEAMAARKPVIGFNDGGTAEIILDGINGLLYNRDEVELAEKMELLIGNEELRKELGENGRHIFEQDYTTEIFLKKFFKFLNN